MARSRRAMLGTVCGVTMAVLAGCSDDGAEASETEPAATETETGSPTATGGEPTAMIQYDGGTVSLDEYREASVELYYNTSGGTVSETDFSAIDQPSGSGTGILEYDEYAEVQFDTAGTYTIQLTVTFEDGTLARDTVDITVE